MAASPSRSCSEGQAHCLALARVNSPRSREVLIRYLGEYLSRPDLDYEGPWAIAALTLACRGAGESVPDRIQAAWPRWSASPGREVPGAAPVSYYGMCWTNTS